MVIKIKSSLKWLFIGLVLLFIYAPILLLTVYSFNEAETINSGWVKFSWTHYEYFFNMENQPLPIVINTLLLAIVVADRKSVV